MINTKTKFVGLFAALIVSTAFSHSVFAGAISAKERKVVEYTREKSAQSKAALENAIAELKSAANYNSASLTEIKFLGMLDRIIAWVRGAREILSPDQQVNVQQAVEKLLGVQLSEGPYIKTAEQFEVILSKLGDVVSAETEIETLASEILSSGDDKNLDAFQAKVNEAAQALVQAATSYEEFAKANLPATEAPKKP